MDKFADYPACVRVVLFLLLLGLLWLPFALPLYLWLGAEGAYSVVPLVVLYVIFVGWLRVWGQKVHRHPQPLCAHGLAISARNRRELLIGVVTGLSSLGLLFLVEGWLGWLVWHPLPDGFWRILIEGFLVGLGVGLAEELLFRGWLLDELRYSWGFQSALWASGLFYAALHFIKPWQAILTSLPSFPGLLLLGLTLGLARHRTQGRLGLAIGLHGGLVWGYYLIDVGDWANYPKVVPDWVTGIYQNPLAGSMGVLFLLLMTAGIHYFPRHSVGKDVT